MVSAIITTYKRPPEIVKRAVQSVLNQSYKNIELLIVDDSPDTYALRNDVRDMANSFGGSVRYIPHERNMGACAARNTGIANAKGEFVAFLDDDDEWLPEKIEKQLNVIKQNDDAALVYCGWFTSYAENGGGEIQKTKFHKGKVFDKLILENFISSTSFPLIRKTVLKNLGGFDEQMPAAQDHEMWLRIAKNYEIDYVKEPLVRYYVHKGEQITKNPEKKADALKRLLIIHADYLKKHPKAYSVRILRMAYFYSKKDLSAARKLFLKAVAIYPIPTPDMLKNIKWLYVIPWLNCIKGSKNK